MSIGNLYDGHKMLWHLDRIVDWKKNRVVAPVYMEISPLSFCNHQCTFCGVDYAQNNLQKLDIHLYKNFIEMAHKVGLRSVMFAGDGEPTLHSELSEMIRYTKQSGIDVSLTTNGTHVNYEYLKSFLPFLSWIRFSFNGGDLATYKKVHNGLEGDYKKAVTAISDCVRLKNELGLNTAIGMQMVVVPENIDSSKNLIEIAKLLKVDYLSFKPFSRNPKMLNKREVVYSEDDLAKLVELISSQDSSSTNIFIRKDSFKEYENSKSSYSRCLGLPFWGYLTSGGDFYTCANHIGDDRFKVGNISDHTFASMIYSKQREKSIQFACEELNVHKECRMNCRMARINEFLEKVEEIPDHVNFI